MPGGAVAARPRSTASWLIIAVTMGLVLAGCLDDGSPSFTDDQGDGGDPTGTRSPAPTGSVDDGNEEEPAGDARIVGTISDDELRPLSGATVKLQAEGRQALTDGAGRFEFGKLGGGTYTLVANRTGYESVGLNVPVEAGQTKEITILLASVVTGAPFIQLDQASFTLDVAVSVYVSQGSGHNIPLEAAVAGLRAVQFEADWEESSVLSPTMNLRAWVLDFEATLCETEGRPPLVCPDADNTTTARDGGWNECKPAGEEAPEEETCRVRWYLKTASEGFYQDQKFTVYSSFFFHQEMPDGYQARPAE